MNKEEITKDTNLGKLISTHPETIDVLLKYGLHCAMCPASGLDSIEEGAKIHGFEDTKIEKLIEDLRAEIKKPQAE